jgi:hypothetical protein
MIILLVIPTKVLERTDSYVSSTVGLREDKSPREVVKEM